jgi:hypothetical protein
MEGKQRGLKRAAWYVGWGLCALIAGGAVAAAPDCDTSYGAGYVNAPVPSLQPGWPTSGLPPCVKDETQYYVPDFTYGKYQPVAAAAQAADRFYVRFDIGMNSWIWVSVNDPRAVAPGSKLQGKRLGLPATDTDSRGLDWYRLSDDWFTWTKVTDRDLPEISRRDFNGHIEVWQTYPSDWESLGGQLDPLPQDRPWCQLTVSPARIQANGPVTVHMVIEGIASQAWVNNQPVRIVRQGDLQSADITFTAVAPGFASANGKLSGSAGDATCQVYYTVFPTTAN